MAIIEAGELQVQSAPPSSGFNRITFEAAMKRYLHRLFENEYPWVTRPIHTINMQGTRVELWTSHRKLPMLLKADGIIVPVGTDLKMIVGAGKFVRDYTACQIQYEANRAAPLRPGDAFIGSGGKYRFKKTALAVIFDEQKRTNSGVIRLAVRKAAELISQYGGTSLILPDFTENLIQQPNWITEEVQRETAEMTAVTMMEAVQACKGTVKTIKIWVWDKKSVPFFTREMKRLENAH